MSKLTRKQQEALIWFFEELATALEVELPEDASDEYIESELLDRAINNEPVLLANGKEAYIDRILPEPDHRGIRYFGVVEMETIYGDQFFKQIAWDANFKHSNGDTGISEFDIDRDQF